MTSPSPVDGSADFAQEPVDNEALQLWSNAVQKLIYLTQGLREGDKGDAELGKEFEEFKEYLIEISDNVAGGEVTEQDLNRLNQITARMNDLATPSGSPDISELSQSSTSSSLKLEREDKIGSILESFLIAVKKNNRQQTSGCGLNHVIPCTGFHEDICKSCNYCYLCSSFSKEIHTFIWNIGNNEVTRKEDEQILWDSFELAYNNALQINIGSEPKVQSHLEEEEQRYNSQVLIENWDWDGDVVHTVEDCFHCFPCSFISKEIHAYFQAKKTCPEGYKAFLDSSFHNNLRSGFDRLISFVHTLQNSTSGHNHSLCCNTVLPECVNKSFAALIYSVVKYSSRSSHRRSRSEGYIDVQSSAAKVRGRSATSTLSSSPRETSSLDRQSRSTRETSSLDRQSRSTRETSSLDRQSSGTRETSFLAKQAVTQKGQHEVLRSRTSRSSDRKVKSRVEDFKSLERRAISLGDLGNNDVDIPENELMKAQHEQKSYLKTSSCGRLQNKVKTSVVRSTNPPKIVPRPVKRRDALEKRTSTFGPERGLVTQRIQRLPPTGRSKEMKKCNTSSPSLLEKVVSDEKKKKTTKAVSALRKSPSWPRTNKSVAEKKTSGSATKLSKKTTSTFRRSQDFKRSRELESLKKPLSTFGRGRDDSPFSALTFRDTNGGAIKINAEKYAPKKSERTIIGKVISTSASASSLTKTEKVTVTKSRGTMHVNAEQKPKPIRKPLIKKKESPIEEVRSNPKETKIQIPIKRAAKSTDDTEIEDDEVFSKTVPEKVDVFEEVMKKEQQSRTVVKTDSAPRNCKESFKVTKPQKQNYEVRKKETYSETNSHREAKSGKSSVCTEILQLVSPINTSPGGLRSPCRSPDLEPDDLFAELAKLQQIYSNTGEVTVYSALQTTNIGDEKSYNVEQKDDSQRSEDESEGDEFKTHSTTKTTSTTSSNPGYNRAISSPRADEILQQKTSLYKMLKTPTITSDSSEENSSDDFRQRNRDDDVSFICTPSPVPDKSQKSSQAYHSFHSSGESSEDEVMDDVALVKTPIPSSGRYQNGNQQSVDHSSESIHDELHISGEEYVERGIAEEKVQIRVRLDTNSFHSSGKSLEDEAADDVALVKTQMRTLGVDQYDNQQLIDCSRESINDEFYISGEEYIEEEIVEEIVETRVRSDKHTFHSSGESSVDEADGDVSFVNTPIPTRGIDKYGNQRLVNKFRESIPDKLYISGEDEYIEGEIVYKIVKASTRSNSRGESSEDEAREWDDVSLVETPILDRRVDQSVNHSSESNNDELYISGEEEYIKEEIVGTRVRSNTYTKEKRVRQATFTKEETVPNQEEYVTKEREMIEDSVVTAAQRRAEERVKRFKKKKNAEQKVLEEKQENERQMAEAQKAEKDKIEKAKAEQKRKLDARKASKIKEVEERKAAKLEEEAMIAEENKQMIIADIKQRSEEAQMKFEEAKRLSEERQLADEKRIEGMRQKKVEQKFEEMRRANIAAADTKMVEDEMYDQQVAENRRVLMYEMQMKIAEDRRIVKARRFAERWNPGTITADITNALEQVHTGINSFCKPVNKTENVQKDDYDYEEFEVEEDYFEDEPEYGIHAGRRSRSVVFGETTTLTNYLIETTTEQRKQRVNETTEVFVPRTPDKLHRVRTPTLSGSDDCKEQLRTPSRKKYKPISSSPEFLAKINPGHNLHFDFTELNTFCEDTVTEICEVEKELSRGAQKEKRYEVEIQPEYNAEVQVYYEEGSTHGGERRSTYYETSTSEESRKASPFGSPLKRDIVFDKTISKLNMKDHPSPDMSISEYMRVFNPLYKDSDFSRNRPDSDLTQFEHAIEKLNQMDDRDSLSMSVSEYMKAFNFLHASKEIRKSKSSERMTVQIDENPAIEISSERSGRKVIDNTIFELTINKLNAMNDDQNSLDMSISEYMKAFNNMYCETEAEYSNTVSKSALRPDDTTSKSVFRPDAASLSVVEQAIAKLEVHKQRQDDSSTSPNEIHKFSQSISINGSTPNTTHLSHKSLTRETQSSEDERFVLSESNDLKGLIQAHRETVINNTKKPKHIIESQSDIVQHVNEVTDEQKYENQKSLSDILDVYERTRSRNSSKHHSQNEGSYNEEIMNCTTPNVYNRHSLSASHPTHSFSRGENVKDILDKDWVDTLSLSHTSPRHTSSCSNPNHHHYEPCRRRRESSPCRVDHKQELGSPCNKKRSNSRNSSSKIRRSVSFNDSLNNEEGSKQADTSSSSGVTIDSISNVRSSTKRKPKTPQTTHRSPEMTPNKRRNPNDEDNFLPLTETLGQVEYLLDEITKIGNSNKKSKSPNKSVRMSKSPVTTSDKSIFINSDPSYLSPPRSPGIFISESPEEPPPIFITHSPLTNHVIVTSSSPLPASFIVNSPVSSPQQYISSHCSSPNQLVEDTSSECNLSDVEVRGSNSSRSSPSKSRPNSKTSPSKFSKSSPSRGSLSKTSAAETKSQAMDQLMMRIGKEQEILTLKREELEATIAESHQILETSKVYDVSNDITTCDNQVIKSRSSPVNSRVSPTGMSKPSRPVPRPISPIGTSAYDGEMRRWEEENMNLLREHESALQKILKYERKLNRLKTVVSDIRDKRTVVESRIHSRMSMRSTPCISPSVSVSNLPQYIRASGVAMKDELMINRVKSGLGSKIRLSDKERSISPNLRKKRKSSKESSGTALSEVSTRVNTPVSVCSPPREVVQRLVRDQRGSPGELFHEENINIERNTKQRHEKRREYRNEQRNEQKNLSIEMNRLKTEQIAVSIERNLTRHTKETEWTRGVLGGMSSVISSRVVTPVQAQTSSEDRTTSSSVTSGFERRTSSIERNMANHMRETERTRLLLGEMSSAASSRVGTPARARSPVRDERTNSSSVTSRNTSSIERNLRLHVKETNWTRSVLGEISSAASSRIPTPVVSRPPSPVMSYKEEKTIASSAKSDKREKKRVENIDWAKSVLADMASASNSRMASASNSRMASASNSRMASASNSRMASASNSRMASASNSRMASASNSRMASASNSRIGTPTRSRTQSPVNETRTSKRREMANMANMDYSSVHTIQSEVQRNRNIKSDHFNIYTNIKSDNRCCETPRSRQSSRNDIRAVTPEIIEHKRTELETLPRYTPFISSPEGHSSNIEGRCIVASPPLQYNPDISPDKFYGANEIQTSSPRHHHHSLSSSHDHQCHSSQNSYRQDSPRVIKKIPNVSFDKNYKALLQTPKLEEPRHVPKTTKTVLSKRPSSPIVVDASVVGSYLEGINRITGNKFSKHTPSPGHNDKTISSTQDGFPSENSLSLNDVMPYHPSKQSSRASSRSQVVILNEGTTLTKVEPKPVMWRTGEPERKGKDSQYYDEQRRREVEVRRVEERDRETRMEELRRAEARRAAKQRREEAKNEEIIREKDRQDKIENEMLEQMKREKREKKREEETLEEIRSQELEYARLEEISRQEGLVREEKRRMKENRRIIERNESYVYDDSYQGYDKQCYYMSNDNTRSNSRVEVKYHSSQSPIVVDPSVIGSYRDGINKITGDISSRHAHQNNNRSNSNCGIEKKNHSTYSEHKTSSNHGSTPTFHSTNDHAIPKKDGNHSKETNFHSNTKPGPLNTNPSYHSKSTSYHSFRSKEGAEYFTQESDSECSEESTVSSGYTIDSDVIQSEIESERKRISDCTKPIIDYGCIVDKKYMPSETESSSASIRINSPTVPVSGVVIGNAIKLHGKANANIHDDFIAETRQYQITEKLKGNSRGVSAECESWLQNSAAY